MDPLTVAETQIYTRRAAALLAEDERAAIVDFLSTHPTEGDLVPGTGGVRKLRWARPGSGKSGGLRVIYYFHSELIPLWLLMLFAKNDQSDLDPDQKKAVRQIVENIKERLK